ncbi:MAG: hypothetical protein ACJAXI_000028 [Crocinitomicaceae bacterium]|jgi:hypothetical protein
MLFALVTILGAYVTSFSNYGVLHDRIDNFEIQLF